MLVQTLLELGKMYRKLMSCFRRKKLFLLFACLCVSLTLWILSSLEEFDKPGRALKRNEFLTGGKSGGAVPVSMTTLNKPVVSGNDNIVSDDDKDDEKKNERNYDDDEDDDNDGGGNQNEDDNKDIGPVMLVRAESKNNNNDDNNDNNKNNKKDEKVDQKPENHYNNLPNKDVASKEDRPLVDNDNVGDSKKAANKLDNSDPKVETNIDIQAIQRDNLAKNPDADRTHSSKTSEQIAEAIRNFREKTKVFDNLTQEGVEVHRSVMGALERDKNDTREIDLAQVNPKTQVQFPPYIEYGKPGDPGEGGSGVPKESVKGNDFRFNEEGYQINEFSLLASQKVAIHRTLSDIRNPRCKDEPMEVITIPPCSVILVFHDEAWTTLLRSIHSIIDRTPASALLEIVLLDDNSDQEHLKTPLEVYLKPLKIVRLIRATKRLGLIKARNLGFLYAKGEIIIFLDSHIECHPGWLEPLVGPIVKDPRTVTFPTIAVIDRNTFSVSGVNSNALGTLKIHAMTFTWYTTQLGGVYLDSPTMPGGLYAISRSFFQYLGAYDPELLFWGGENLEISFKIWMCGGRILASACSCVAHVFRSNSPFHSSEMSKAINKNSLRVADIWLDEFKHFYLEKFTYMISEVGDTQVQKRLRRSLQCKNFRWYLDNVNTHLKKQMDVDGTYSGQMKNEGIGQCLVTGVNNIPYLMACNMLHYRQVWQYRSDGYLTMYDKMMYSKGTVNGRPVLSMKDINLQRLDRCIQFSYDQQTHRLMAVDSQLCLDIDPTTPKNNVILAPCNDSSNQRWALQTRRETQDFHRKRGVKGIEW